MLNYNNKIQQGPWPPQSLSQAWKYSKGINVKNGLKYVVVDLVIDLDLYYFCSDMCFPVLCSTMYI